MSSVRLLLPYASTNTPNSAAETELVKDHERTSQQRNGGNPPWKQSRNSSFCITLATCMMAMGKLWMEAANTAEARDRSFLSRNSVGVFKFG